MAVASVFLAEVLAGHCWAVAWLLRVHLSVWLPCLDPGRGPAAAQAPATLLWAFTGLSLGQGLLLSSVC